MAYGLAAGVRVDRRIPPGPAPARGNGRLDHEIPVRGEPSVQLMLRQILLGLEPHRRNDRQTAGLQLAQVVLVRIPVHDPRLVEDPRNRTRPGAELLALGRIIAHGADDHGSRLRPVDVGVVPHGDPRFEPALAQSVGKGLLVGVKVWQFGARRQGHDRIRHAANFTRWRLHGSRPSSSRSNANSGETPHGFGPIAYAASETRAQAAPRAVTPRGRANRIAGRTSSHPTSSRKTKSPAALRPRSPVRTPPGTRTQNPLIKSQLLCQLS